MPTITKTLLNGASDGFTLQSSGFDSASVSSNTLVCVENNPANPSTYIAVFRQGSTTNRYSDWGVPSGALVTGIKILGASHSFIDGSTNQVASANVQFSTDEVSLGSFDVESGIGAGSLLSISKVGSDYVRVQVDISATVEFDTGDYGVLEVQINQIELEVTYSEPDVFVGGEATGSISFSATSTVNTIVSGEISSSIGLSGELENSLIISGNIVSSVDFSASSTVERNLSGTSTGAVVLSGFLATDSTVYLGGTVIGSVALEGNITGGVSGKSLYQNLLGRKYIKPATKRIVKNLP